MSDEPLTKETISEFMHLAEAGEPRDAYIRISVERLKALCTLALRGLEAERVREETLEEAAKKIERMLAPEDEACRENATLKLSIAAIRALKKGTSDANPR